MLNTPTRAIMSFAAFIATATLWIVTLPTDPGTGVAIISFI